MKSFEDDGFHPLPPAFKYLHLPSIVISQTAGSPLTVELPFSKSKLYWNEATIVWRDWFLKSMLLLKVIFFVNGKCLVEVGGKSKQQYRIVGAANGFTVKDDIEIGNDNIIPLWLFGFLY